METLFPLILFGIILSFSCSYGFLQTSSIHLRSYPKKYDSVLHRHLNILNRRYLKPTKTELTKRSNTDKLYTVFQSIPENRKKLNFPESPYFSLGTNINQNKVRVKKVLSQFLFKPYIRKKRGVAKKSASKAVPAKKQVEKIKKKIPKNADANEKSVESAKKRTVDKSDKKKSKKGGPKTTPKVQSGKLIAKKDEGKTKAKPKIGEGKITAKKQEGKTTTKKPKKAAKITSSKKEKVPSKKKSKHARRHPELLNGTRRLVAARDTAIEEYPYVVSIQKDGEHWCAGSLLNQRLVITTANCVWKSTYYSKLRIRAGSRYTDRGGQVAKVQEVMKHPKWSARKSPDNDIALLLLDRFFKFSHSCHAVDLPNRLMLPVFDDAWVTSWGAERRDGIYEKPEMTLQVYHARFIDRDKCNNVTTRFGVTVSPNFICLAQTGRRAPCTRDTGAPAVSDGVLWGMASWGIRKLCGTERFPAMFSYTASMSNMDFISAATTALMSEQREYPFPGRFEYKLPPPTTEPHAG